MQAQPEMNPNALARLEMVREKTKITGRNPALPSGLERAAQEWKRQQEEQERLRFQAGLETSVVALQRIALQAKAKAHATNGEISWRPHRWGDQDKPRRVMLNPAMVSRIAQHLKATEWARAKGKSRARPTTLSLEKWAETWRRNKQQEERSLSGSLRPGE